MSAGPAASSPQVAERQRQIVSHARIVVVRALEGSDHLRYDTLHPAPLRIHRDDLRELESRLPTPVSASDADFVEIVHTRFLVRDEPGEEEEQPDTERDDEGRNDEKLNESAAEADVLGGRLGADLRRCLGLALISLHC